MSTYITEQEQIEQLKNFIKQYGKSIVLGMLLAIILLSSWNYWRDYRNKNLLHASILYDEMLTLRAQNNVTKTTALARKLHAHYASTPYAVMATFLLARDSVLKKDYTSASNFLTWVMNHSHNAAFKQIARLRKGRVLITLEKPLAALSLLETIDDPTYLGLVYETRGDAYLALHNVNAAKEAYQLAIQQLPKAEITRPVLQMKFDNLQISQSTKV